jgi:membrane fusion protein (multidrug efflux system)
VNKVGIVFLGLLMSFVHVNANANGKQNAKQNVFVAPVLLEKIYDVVESVGTTKASESVIITSEVDSKVTEVHFKPGQIVVKGELLFTLNDTEEKADVAAVKSDFTQKKRAYERAKTLVKENAISDVTYEDRQSEFYTVEANLEAVNARLDLLEIRAPFSGTLGILDLSVGEYIQSGTPMVSLNDLSIMKLDFNIPTRYLSVLKIGDSLEAKSSAYKKSFKGEISFIDTEVNAITRTVRVRALIPNPENLLKGGMFMTVKMFAQQRDSLTIPEEALIKRGEGNFVFKIVEEENKTIVKYQTVEIGARQFGSLEILSGLEAGDRVVHHGVLKLKDGVEVVIKAIEKNDDTLIEMLNSKEGS